MPVKRSKLNVLLPEENGEIIKNLGSYIENGDYFTSKKYGELINIEGLKGSQSEKVIAESLSLMVESDEFREKERLSLAGFCVCLIGTVIPLLGMRQYMSAEGWVQFSVISMLLWAVFGLLAQKYSTKSELKLNEAREMDDESNIIDKNGEKVNVIWFLYHNMNFKNNDERIKFLFENYSRYNYPLEMGVEKYQRYNKNVKEYLSMLVKSKNNEYLSSEDNVQEIGDSLVSV